MIYPFSVLDSNFLAFACYHSILWRLFIPPYNIIATLAIVATNCIMHFSCFSSLVILFIGLFSPSLLLIFVLDRKNIRHFTIVACLHFNSLYLIRIENSEILKPRSNLQRQRRKRKRRDWTKKKRMSTEIHCAEPVEVTMLPTSFGFVATYARSGSTASVWRSLQPELST